MLFAATRTDLEIILNRVKADRERQISYYIPHMGHLLKKKRNNWTYLQNRNRLTDIKAKLMFKKGKRQVERNRSEAWDVYTHSSIDKVDNQQGSRI